MSDQFISVRETAQLLGTTEKKIMDLVEKNELQAYRIAGQFLRLKKSEILALKSKGTVAVETAQIAYTPAERLRDFIYFNDFYILAVAVILILLYIIFYVV
ncbi:MAG: helix-turn-helix domain-containing protein [Candidatus Omnitrophota bacterium]